MVFHSEGDSGFAPRPIEGTDPFAPEDPECVRHGYQYRVHMPSVFTEPLCAVFYEDDFIGSEQLLGELGFRKMVRFAVTPVSQAFANPPPASTHGKRRITPQEYFDREDKIERGAAQFNAQESHAALDERFSRSTL